MQILESWRLIETPILSPVRVSSMEHFDLTFNLGQGTPAFWKLVNNGYGIPNIDCSFSIGTKSANYVDVKSDFIEVAHTRTLDFVADSEAMAAAWIDGLGTVLSVMSGRKPNSFRKKNYSFRGDEVESSYSPHRSSRNEGSVRSLLDVESAKRQMFSAAYAGDCDLLQDILEAGINVNLMEPSRNDTPLMIACRAGNTEIVRLCLHFGAKNDPHPDFGHTALHVAVISAQLGAASVLLEAAAESDADVVIVNLADPAGLTPLHIAAEKGLVSMIELLLSHGAEIGRRDGSGKTALHIASSLGHKKCLAILANYCGDALLSDQDSSGNTPLHSAADSGQLSCVKLLLESAADVSCRNHAGKTPYMLANTKGQFQVAQLLLQYHQTQDADYANSTSRIYSGTKVQEPLNKGTYSMPKIVPPSEALPRPHTASISPRPSSTPSSSGKLKPLFFQRSSPQPYSLISEHNLQEGPRASAGEALYSGDGESLRLERCFSHFY